MDTLSPAGWYADNTGRGLRYWDGANWTSHVIMVAPQVADPFWTPQGPRHGSTGGLAGASGATN